MLCPNCNQTLTPPLSGRRQTCSFCGWVQSSAEQEGGPDPEPIARKAEEIARERQLDTAPVWRYFLIPVVALASLVLVFNLLVSTYHKDRPADQGGSPAPDVSASPGTQQPQTTPFPAVVPASPSASPSPQATPTVNVQASNIPQTPAGAQTTAQPVASASPQGSVLPPSPAVSAGNASQTPDESQASQRSPIPVSSLPSLVPPSNVLITPPPLPSPMLPSPRL